MAKIEWQINRHKNHHQSTWPITNNDAMAKVQRFHQTIPGYEPTPLYSLVSLADYLGVAGIFVKDEAKRFNLNSFKSLGSSYALASYLAQQLNIELASFSTLKEQVGNFPVHTFATATDGNHGRGVAWFANMLGQKSVVYMPKGSSKYRLQKLLDLGAQAKITADDYDDTVRFVSQLADKQGWILVQDTAWKGYRDIPTMIMQGYLTIIAELIEQFKVIDKRPLTHVILQAGVGSFAGAMVAGLQQIAGKSLKIIIVEPTYADCLYQSAYSEAGDPKRASGDLSTIMAGLACGEPNPIAWDILKQTADCFIACTDSVAATGMRILGNPLNNDPKIISGESGAVSLGVLFQIRGSMGKLNDLLALNSSSRVLVINTEGDTDPGNYRKICWEGAYPNIL